MKKHLPGYVMLPLSISWQFKFTVMLEPIIFLQSKAQNWHRKSDSKAVKGQTHPERVGDMRRGQ